MTDGRTCPPHDWHIEWFQAIDDGVSEDVTLRGCRRCGRAEASLVAPAAVEWFCRTWRRIPRLPDGWLDAIDAWKSCRPGADPPSVAPARAAIDMLTDGVGRVR